MPDPTPDPTIVFDRLRPLLVRVAYRMLGSVADAEDVVQETFIRWMGVDRDTVREPEAFLRRIVTRLCLNSLNAARNRREIYLGPWLPEPVVDTPVDDRLDDLSLPLMMALERLSPLERAAFLLHDVFGVGFDEISAIIAREPAACRQLASRARDHLRRGRPRFSVPKDRGAEIAQAFFTASRTGDMATLRSLLAEDVVAYVDGGGNVRAPLEPILGRDGILAVHAELARIFAENGSRLCRYAAIDGLPGFVTIEAGGLLQTTALDVADAGIVAIYVTRNPDKLRHLHDTVFDQGRPQ